MRVVHVPTNEGTDLAAAGEGVDTLEDDAGRAEETEGGPSERVLASRVDVADSMYSQTKGLMFRSSIPEDYAMVFDFGRAGQRFIHMLFVRVSLDVLWLRDERVVKVAQLDPWRGIGRAKADRVLELPAGAATDVSVGDTVRVEGADGD